MAEQYRSRVYTDRPAYADYDAPHKFQAIQGIVARRLREHPKAICSYSGGADSDILIHLIERKDNTTMCFTETGDGKFRLRPLYYVSDADKAWYKEQYGIRYSDAYEVYGLKRTGCCGCPISFRAVSDLELIGEYEPNIKTAAWNIFGKSYEYRIRYNEYKADKDALGRELNGQCRLELK